MIPKNSGFKTDYPTLLAESDCEILIFGTIESLIETA